MPVQEFNEHQCREVDPQTGERLKNYWGYDPLGFFAPKASYASVREDGAQVLEFKEMVRAFHREGIEVILDVVFNHTVEGDELGPTVSFRGIDNAIYYWLDDDKRFYRDFTGTGQTVNATHPVVRDSSSMRCATGSWRCMSTAFASTSPRCSVGTPRPRPGRCALAGTHC